MENKPGNAEKEEPPLAMIPLISTKPQVFVKSAASKKSARTEQNQQHSFHRGVGG